MRKVKIYVNFYSEMDACMNSTCAADEICIVTDDKAEGFMCGKFLKFFIDQTWFNCPHLSEVRSRSEFVPIFCIGTDEEASAN